MGVKLEPHTIDWFLRLEVTDPGLFEHVNRIIDREDQQDLCGSCGGSPAANYEVMHPKVPQGHVATFRWCDQCADVERRFGRILEPWPRRASA
jgi:hypothetical protein